MGIFGLWRNDDVINSSGYRIGPFEVESTLKLQADVVGICGFVWDSIEVVMGFV